MPLDARGFQLVPNAQPFAQSIGDVLTQNITQELAQRVLSGDQSAMGDLVAKNPMAARQIGSILQDQRQAQEQQRQIHQEMAYRVARGFQTAKDKPGYLLAAAQQLKAAGLKDMAAEVMSDAETYAKDPASVETEYSGIYSMFQPDKQNAALDEFKGKAAAAGLKPGSPEYVKAARVDMGLEARAGTVTGQERIANTPGQTDIVASSEGTIAGAKAGAQEAEKLKAQSAMKPDVEKAVTLAKETAKQIVSQAGEQRSNDMALRMYDTAMTALSDALGGTATGPGVGWLPAVTANAQIAEGAVSAMAPILKQLFRTSGEGTFTDKDQELLLNMIPTRKTLPDARDAQIKAIDAIVRAKLNQPSGAPAESKGKYSIGQVIEVNGQKYKVTGGDLNDPDVEPVQ